jgi:hypothetical protein
MPWFEAISQPGAGQMQYARWLLESRPFLSRIPDDTVIVAHDVATAVPGAGRNRLVGTRDASGTFAMIYTPTGRPFKARMSAVAAREVVAWWFDPRTGHATRIGEFPGSGEQLFIPPNAGEALDFVLVLDDKSRAFAPPGTRR